MELIADALLIAGAVGAALYCRTLAQRLGALSSLDTGLGAAIAALSRQVDELRASLEELRRPTRGGRSVAALMDRRAPSALPDDSVQSVAARMLAANLACIPVVLGPAEPRLIGLVLESDLLRRIYYAGAWLAS